MSDNALYSATARVEGWGSHKNARRVAGLSLAERNAVRRGEEVRIAGCPAYLNQTDRVIVEIGGRFYTRMP
jgi:hypothetical protein